jgi:DeoD family purine-nucleoside phosphorylase
VPIHVRAEPGDYAEACLLPGDPNRARLIAERFLSDVVERNTERGLLGFTGSFEGQPVSVQATGMGSPSLAIVLEELIELGVRRFLRVGTCGSLQQGLGHGELVLALSAVPADGTSPTYTDGEPHVPTGDWDLLHGVVHAAKELGEKLQVGPIVSTDVFYDPDPERHLRWSRRGLLAVEMEAAALFTIAGLRGVQAGCLLAVSDTVIEDTRARISDDRLLDAVERMTRVALTALR